MQPLTQNPPSKSRKRDTKSGTAPLVSVANECTCEVRAAGPLKPVDSGDVPRFGVKVREFDGGFGLTRLPNYLRRSLTAVVILAVTLLASSCAEERPPIDRVQPNAIKKALFTGEWHYQRTVVDVPSSNGFTFVGSTDHSGVSRISWDIQEEYLYARRTTELIKNADDKTLKGEKYQGEVVATFKIEKHFDIVNAYNSTTGEQLNIIEENSKDRPWYKRTYLRVDWSQNLVHNYNLDFEVESMESVPYYIQETDEDGNPNPDAPHFAKDGSYFDVTSKLFAKAGTIEYPGYGEIPLCWFRGEEFTECGAGEYAIRHSFKKIDPNHQYEPLPYKGKTTEVFGFFWTDRMVYNPKTGIREASKERFLTRHNLWVKWRDSNGNLIPHQDRQLRPVVYHVNRDFPDDLKDIAHGVADQWNNTFVDVVKALGYDPGGNRVFILCPNNPVLAGDPAECGGAGNSPRLGDIRYSFMAYVPKYMTYGLLGLGPSNKDPETGEIISGMGYVYHHNNLGAFRVQEMIELLNGTISPTDFVNGEDLTQWVNTVNGHTAMPSRTFSLDDAKHMTHRLANGWAAKVWAPFRAPPTEADVEFQKQHGFNKWIQPALENMYSIGLLNGEMHSPEGKLAQLKNTYIEDLLLNDEIMMAVGHQPGTPMLESQKDAASVVRGGFAKRMKIKAKLREQFAMSRTMYLPEMADDALLGLARELKNSPPDEVYETVRTAIYTAVLAHEVGHSLGLMHNFGGSDDAINYFDDYWKIRNDGKVAPRLDDPITDQEIDAKIYNYAYSSVMDYAGRYTIDGKGIGKYDRAAILFGYAQKAEVFLDNGAASSSDLISWYRSDGDIIQFAGNAPKTIHYTAFFNQMGAKMYEDNNRMLVDTTAFDDQYSTASVDGQVYTRVPYIYCSHNRYNLGDNCLTRDFGADSAERMKNILDELNTWYIARNFPRGKIGVDQYGYVSRYYRRIYDRLKNWNDIYSLYAALLPRFYGEETTETFLNNAATGYGTKTWAVQNAFNYLIQTVLAPDVGSYGGPYTMPDGTSLMKSGVQNPSLTLDVTQGRYYSTSWGDGGQECGYMWWECLHHIGFYLDKVMAIEALTDTSTNFVARATPIDLRQWEIGYYNTFTDQMLRLNTAIMKQDWAKLGPYRDASGKLAFPNYGGNLAETHNNPVDPFATFTIQLYWQVLGQARFPDNFDQSFLDESRVYVMGTGLQPDLPETAFATFRDPTSGLTYGALRFLNKIDGGSGQGIIDRANRMMAWSNYCDDENVNLTTTEDDNCLPVDPSSKDYVTAELLSYIQLIKVMADLSPKMSYGNPYQP